MMRTGRRRLLAIGLGLVLLMSACGGNGDAGDRDEGGRERVAVAIISFSPYGAWYIGRDQGMFDGIDLDIQIIEGIQEKNAAISSASVACMNNTLDSVVLARASGIPVKHVAAPAMSFGLDYMIVSDDIRSVEDFPGKKYGADYGFLNHMWMLLTLQRAGLPFDALEHVVMLPQESAAAFISGGIDIDVNYAPFALQSLNRSDAFVLKSSWDDRTWERGLISESIACNENWLEDNPELAQELIRGWFEAVDWWKRNPDEGDEIIAEGLGWSLEDVKSTQTGAVMLNLGQNLGAFGLGDYQPLCADLPEEAPVPPPAEETWTTVTGASADCEPGYIYSTWDLFSDVYLEAGVSSAGAPSLEALDPSIVEALADRGFGEEYNSNRWIGRIGAEEPFTPAE